MTTGKRDDFAPLREDDDDEDSEYSLLEQNLMLDNAFRDLDMSVAANLGVGLGPSVDDASSSAKTATTTTNSNTKNNGDEELKSTTSKQNNNNNNDVDNSAPFMSRNTLEPGDHSHHLKNNNQNKKLGNNGNDDDDNSNQQSSPAGAGTTTATGTTSAKLEASDSKDVTVVFLAKCWEIDELFEALTKIGFAGKITTD